MFSDHCVSKRRAQISKLRLEIKTPGSTMTKHANPPSPSHSTSSTTFLQLLHNHDIRAEISSYLDARDFLALAASSFGLRQTLRRERWDVNRKLARFVRDPVAFRNLQARTNALISGPFALSFAEGKMWKDSYPVVWVRQEHRDEWMKFMADEGYVQQEKPSATQRYDDEARFDGVVVSTFNGACNRPGYGPVELHIQFAEHNAFASLVQMTEMTCQFNFLTWDKAYVMFARATLLQQKTYPVNTHRLPELGATLKALESIGWPVHDFVPRFQRYTEGNEVRGGPNRSPGDSHSLVIPLDTTGVAPGTLDYENCDFGIHSDRPYFTMFTVPLYHPLLKHDYASCLNTGGYAGKFAFVKEDRLDAILTFEMLKHDESECPPGIPYPDLDDYFSLHRRNTCLGKSWYPEAEWKPPAGWKFVDRHLAGWIRDSKMDRGHVGAMDGMYSP